jgi:hypothetical protein
MLFLCEKALLPSPLIYGDHYGDQYVLFPSFKKPMLPKPCGNVADRLRACRLRAKQFQ